MSIERRGPLSTPPPRRPDNSTGTAWFEAIARIQGTHILSYPFPSEAFRVTPLGTVIDDELAVALWVALRLIYCQISIDKRIDDFSRSYGLGPVPGLFRFPFTYGINLLKVVFSSAVEARRQVAIAQTAGQIALSWLVSLCNILERQSTQGDNSLPGVNTGLIDYYRCLTWRAEDANVNQNRALVPYRPFIPYAPPPSSTPAGPSSSNLTVYSPYQPQILPQSQVPAAPAFEGTGNISNEHILSLFRSMVDEQTAQNITEEIVGPEDVTIEEVA